MKYLSICAVIKNETRYLKEWIDHHIRQGVEHFFFYDNESTDSPRDFLADYTDKITWHRTKGQQQQRVSYNHMIREYGKDTEWTAFIDIDEFLYSGKDKQFVETLKRDYDLPHVVGLAPHWIIFGSNGHLEYSPEPVTQRFTMRSKHVNHHIKSIMRMSKTYSTGMNVHTFRAQGIIVDENFAAMPIEYAIMSPATADILRLNHYVTKSKAECEAKRLRGRADTGGINGEDFFEAHDQNDVVDKRILEL